ncbi:ankyrin repeat domain-containing protein, partial [Legionella geestiana]
IDVPHYRRTALHLAFLAGDVVRVKWLVENGAQIVKDDYGNYPHDLTDLSLREDANYQRNRLLCVAAPEYQQELARRTAPAHQPPSLAPATQHAPASTPVKAIQAPAPIMFMPAPKPAKPTGADQIRAFHKRNDDYIKEVKRRSEQRQKDLDCRARQSPPSGLYAGKPSSSGMFGQSRSSFGKMECMTTVNVRTGKPTPDLYCRPMGSSQHFRTFFPDMSAARASCSSIKIVAPKYK